MQASLVINLSLTLSIGLLINGQEHDTFAICEEVMLSYRDLVHVQDCNFVYSGSDICLYTL